MSIVTGHVAAHLVLASWVSQAARRFHYRHSTLQYYDVIKHILIRLAQRNSFFTNMSTLVRLNCRGPDEHTWSQFAVR
jgi:hypothetical protein